MRLHSAGKFAHSWHELYARGILRAKRRTPERSLTSSIRHDASSVPIRTEGQQSANQAQGADLFVLDSVDGISSVEELAMMLAMDEGEVLQILQRLHEQTLIRWEEQAPEPAATPPDGTEEAVRPPMAEARQDPATYFQSQTTDDEEDATETLPFITAPAAQSAAQPPVRTLSRTSAQPTEIPTEKPTSPPPVPPSRPAAQNTSTPRGEIAKTPRQHLDTSWWKGAKTTQEPDEVLTHREISHSGLRFAPSTLDDASATAQESSESTEEKPTAQHAVETSKHDVITDRVHPVSGSIPVDETADEPEPTQQLSRPKISESHDSKTRDTSGYVDEVAHTRTGANPLLPDIEYDDAWTTDDEDTTEIQLKDIWQEEPITPELKAESGQWSVDEARCVSYYLRLIENGTYYDIFGVENDATPEAIVAAAQRIERNIDFRRLDLRGSPVGKHAIDKVHHGIERALDVLRNQESRAQYDAALDALAAFKLS